MGKFVDLTGMKVNRLTVVCKDLERSNNKRVIWKCKCDCGNYCYPRTCDLRSEHIVSCGCLGKERRSKGTIKANKERAKHNMYGTRFYNIWDGMKARCYNSNHSSYDSYGGRGIAVCEEWQEFVNFYNDMYESYEEHFNRNNGDTTLERKNVNGNYSKDNCCWIINRDQYKNQRKTIKVNMEGKLLTLTEVSKKYGVPYSTLHRRYKNNKNLLTGEVK